LRGVSFIPVFFKPEFSKFAGQVCRGLLVQVQEQEKFRSVNVYYELIRLVKQFHPEDFSWQPPPYEFEFERLPIDMICGADLMRKSIEKNIPFAGIKAGKQRIDQRVRDREWRVDTGSFWQIHPRAAETLVSTVLEFGRPVAGEHWWDLYSGVGLFSAFLAEAVGVTGVVHAVESGSSAVRDARRSLHDLQCQPEGLNARKAF